MGIRAFCRAAETQTLKRKHLGADMDDREIIRLNVERYRRLLRTEADETARRSIQKMLEEFEAKLSATRPRLNRATKFDPRQC